MPSIGVVVKEVPTYVGVDPGLGGGVAWIRGTRLEFVSTPDSYTDIWDLFTDLESIQPVFATIEWISPAIFGVGKASMSKLYGNYRALMMGLVATQIPFEEVRPVQWQSGLQIPKKAKGENQTQWKNRLKAKAQQLFPGRKITLKVSDAILIAEYCRRVCTGTLRKGVK